MALVLVLIFGVAAFSLTTVMLTLTNAGLKGESFRHREKNLQAIVRYGMNTAVAEINRNRKAAYDPTGNGAGAILVGPDGKRGWPVLDSQGRVLGRFTSIVKTSDLSNGQKQRVLQVVAVDGAEYPDSQTELDRRVAAGQIQFMVAELEIETWGVAFDRNALSIRGPATKNGAGGFRITSSNRLANQVLINGHNKPAVNITDQEAHRKFTGRDPTTTDDTIVDPLAINGWKQLDGSTLAETAATPTTLGTGYTDAEVAAGRATTVTQEQSGLINQETLGEVAAGVDKRVAEVIQKGTEITAANANGTLPANEHNYYYVNSPLDLGPSEILKGKGTLVINAGVTIKKGLDWDGDVIIANKDGARVQVDGNLIVSNVLAIQGYGTATDMGIDIKGEVIVGTVDKPGFYTVLGDGDTKNPMTFQSGSKGATVNGIFTIMGDEINMTFDTGSIVTVTGSLALIAPTDANKGIDVAFKNSAKLTLNYNDLSFDGAVNAIGGFYVPGDGSEDPIQVTSYLEAPATRLDTIGDHVLADEAEPTKYALE